MPPAPRAPSPDPLLVAIDMGYGHLRAAWALADAFRVPVLRIDAPPLADEGEVRTWDRARWIYEICSRVYRRPLVGLAARRFLDTITAIKPEVPAPHDGVLPRTVHFQARLIREGMGAGVVRRMREEGLRLVTTFYTPGLAANQAGLENAFVVVTDADVHRVWAPEHAQGTCIRYLVPSERARARLLSYGVPADRIAYTGFPLPLSLVGQDGDEALRANLARRLARLAAPPDLAAEGRVAGVDVPETERGRPPHLLLAIGGAGAQTEIVHRMLASLGRAIRAGRLSVTLVAGVRPRVARAFRRDVKRARLADRPEVRVLFEADFDAYWQAFNAALGEADVVWTKPSELVFYAALGLPLVLAPHVGAHERHNPAWVLEAEAGVPQGPPAEAEGWLLPMLADGTLARAAWNGYRRLPHDGTRTIVRIVRGESA